MILCQNYIEHMLRVYTWDTGKSKHTNSPSPVSDTSCLKTIVKEYGPDEGNGDSCKLEVARDFERHTLLSEMLFVYVTCQLHIGFAITTMNKSSTKLSQVHYELLKGITKYLHEKSTGVSSTNVLLIETI